MRITKKQLRRIILEAMPEGGVPDVVGAATGVYGEKERRDLSDQGFTAKSGKLVKNQAMKRLHDLLVKAAEAAEEVDQLAAQHGEAFHGQEAVELASWLEHVWESFGAESDEIFK